MHGHNRLKSTASGLLSIFSFGGRLLNAPARASLIYTATNVFSRAAALIFTPFFTRLLSTSEYGRYALFHTYLALLGAIGTLEIGGGIILSVLASHRTSPRASLRCAAVLSIFSVTLTFLGFTVYRRLFGIAPIFKWDAALMYLSVVSSSMINLFIAYCRFFYRWRLNILITLILSVISPLLSLAALTLYASATYDKTAVKIAIGTLVVLMISIPITIYMLLSKSGESEKPGLKSGIGELLRLALPMLPYYLSVMIVNESDKFIIEHYLGISELGKYSVAYSAGVAASVISTGASQILSAWIVRKCTENKYERINSVLLASIRILSSLILVFLAFAPELFRILAPDEYYTAIFSVYPVAIAIVPIFIISVFTTLSLGEKKTLPPVAAGLSTAAFHAVTAHILIPRYGISSAGIVHLLSYVFLLAVLMISFKLLSRKTIINANKTFQIVLFSITFSFICYEIRNVISARILLAIIALLYAAFGIYKNRDLIREK